MLVELGAEGVLVERVGVLEGVEIECRGKEEKFRFDCVPQDLEIL